MNGSGVAAVVAAVDCAKTGVGYVREYLVHWGLIRVGTTRELRHRSWPPDWGNLVSMPWMRESSISDADSQTRSYLWPERIEVGIVIVVPHP